MDIILFAIPGFIALILIEWVWGLARGNNTYRLADTIASISLGSISRLRGLVFLGLGGWFYTKAAGDWRLLDLPDSGWGIWLFAMVAYDFSYYWFHRVSHEVNLFWAAHVVHHQSEDYNLGTALRQSGSGLFGFIFYLPWLVVGIPPEILFASGALNLVYQFWVHTQHVRRLGPLEWFLITPSNHRVHHAQNRIYIDRNYGGILCIWDRMFGSFQDELDEEPCIYGIRKPLNSWNPIWANVHVYWATLQDSWRATHWQDKIKVWFKGPGWRPEDVATAWPVQKTDLDDFHKFEPPAPRPYRAYAFFQFFCTTLAGTGLLIGYTTLPGSLVWACVLWLMLGYFTQSRFTQNFSYSLHLEGLRLLIGTALVFQIELPAWLFALLLSWQILSFALLLTLAIHSRKNQGLPAL